MAESSIIGFLLVPILLAVFILLFILALAFLVGREDELIKELFTLNKHPHNPVIAPPEYGDWEAVGTFNPGAVHDDDGRVHIIYRAIGADGVSRFGYAMSEDGKTFTNRSPYPVFTMRNPSGDKAQYFDPVMYPSGGSWGGAEDPRLVRIDGRVFMTFNAFDGWDYIRMAVTSIAENDFFSQKWKWSQPIFISAPGTISKNWVLFPEKINGKFAILHGIVPDVMIEYVDSIDRGLAPINSPRKFGPQPGRKNFWDNRIRGAGPPPIKTTKGWLVLYHGITDGDHRYKIGAMLLDLHNPSKIIGRTPVPILEPDCWYEDDWKPGIVYASAALIRGEELFVYYGGGDKHVCVAHKNLNEVLNLLVR